MVNPQEDDKRVEICGKILKRHLDTIQDLPKELKSNN
jgi:hypothetical protein